MSRKDLTGLDTSKYRYCIECGKILPLCHFDVSSINKNKTKIYSQICKRCEKNRQLKPKMPIKMKVLDGNKNVQFAEDITENDNPINVKLINAFETFVQIEGTYNYWISNYGRVVNNLRNPFKYHVHSTASHYTMNFFDIDGSVSVEDHYTKNLMGKIFLKNPNNYTKIWFIDGDKNNFYYKNLVYVSNKDYDDLVYGRKTTNDIEIKQEYYEYPNKARSRAYAVYQGIYNRCYKRDKYTNYHDCYDGATICKEWLENPELFIDWYLENYYPVKDEIMVVDKDLFGNGSKEYSPDNCCIVPVTINAMLTNCKKHDNPEYTNAADLPLGVRYNTDTHMYYGEITPFGHDEPAKLEEWDTPEEAFDEYRIIKKADITVMAVKYKNYIPQRVFDALMRYEVQPYIEN